MSIDSYTQDHCDYHVLLKWPKTSQGHPLTKANDPIKKDGLHCLTVILLTIFDSN